MKDLMKHGSEFASAIENHAFERAGELGLYFPKAKAFLAGAYTHDVNGRDERTDHNLLPDEALVYLLRTGLLGGSGLPKWYIALYSASYTPVAGLTAQQFAGTANEITSASEGYTEATRQEWKPDAIQNNAVINQANKASFTIATANNLTVQGAALLSEAAKGSTAGVIMSCTKFQQPRTLYNTDVFNLSYRVSLSAA